MNTDLHTVLVTMRHYGGGFASRLADAWMRADSMNSARLAEAFTDLLERYRAMAEQAKAVTP